MGTFTNILIDIEEMWADGKSFDEIAKAINKQYGTIYTEAEIDNAIEQIIEAQDQGYNDDMDGDLEWVKAK